MMTTPILAALVASLSPTPPPPPGVVEFTGVRVLLTVACGDGGFAPMEVNIRQKRFNELRLDAGLPPCQRVGMTLELLTGPDAAACGLPAFVKVHAEVIDPDFGGDWGRGLGCLLLQ